MVEIEGRCRRHFFSDGRFKKKKKEEEVKEEEETAAVACSFGRSSFIKIMKGDEE